MIEKRIRDALFKEIHKTINESAESVARIDSSGLSYPPGIELTTEEVEALASLGLSDAAKTGLRKLAADACAYPLFHFFSLLDAVADPDTDLGDVWLGATIGKKPEGDEPMLHDELYESYWLWEEEKDG